MTKNRETRMKSVDDNQWKIVQEKTFTKWINSKLGTKKGHVEITNIYDSISDSITLLRLLEIISGTEIKYNKKPEHRLQYVENIILALKTIKNNGVQLTNIGALDIVDKNEKLILGLIWTIILRFTMADIIEGRDDITAKEGLLLWCQRRTAGYKGVSINDFSYSWQNGLAFAALIHSYNPELINYNSLNASEKHENLKMAFKIAAEQLNIPQLLDVEDIADVLVPEELSIMTYVSQYFHAFSAHDKTASAARRISSFLAALNSVKEMEIDYSDRAERLIKSINGIITEWKSDKFDDIYQTNKTKLTQLNRIRMDLKRTWGSEKKDLDALYGNIQTKLKTYNLNPYVPEDAISISTLDIIWKDFLKEEQKRQNQLSKKIQKIRETLKEKYNLIALEIQDKTNEISRKITLLDDNIENQVLTIEKLFSEITQLKDSDLLTASQLYEQAIEANIGEEDIICNVEDISYYIDLVIKGLEDRKVFLEHQKVIRTAGNLNPQQLSEIEATFHHFDYDKSNKLQENEFKAACSSLGKYLEDEEASRIFSTLSTDNEMSFEQFLCYMTKTMVDSGTSEQLIESFRLISGNSDIVTREHFENQHIDPILFEHLFKTESGDLKTNISYEAMLRKLIRSN